MRTFNNNYRGYKINIVEESADKATYRVLNLDKTVVEDTEGYCVTASEALEICQEMIDDIISENTIL